MSPIGRIVRTAVCVIFPMIAVYTAVLFAAWLANPNIHREDGLMENVQALSLGVACMVLLGSIFLPSMESRRFGSWVLALLFAMMLCREVDVETYALPEAMVFVTSGMGRNILFGLACLATFVIGMSNWRKHFDDGFSVLIASFPWLAAGCTLYLSSWPLDKNIIPIQPETGLFLEEAFECSATLCFLIAAFSTCSLGTAIQTRACRITTGPS